MTGEEVKQYIKMRGLTMSDIARETGTTPQNIAAKLSRDNVKPSFLDKINAIIDKCCPPLPAEMESAVFGSNINGSNSPNVSQNVGADAAALRRENDVLRQQNEFLQKQVERLMTMLEK